jgi:Tol biopolymer transport system component
VDKARWFGVAAGLLLLAGHRGVAIVRQPPAQQKTPPTIGAPAGTDFFGLTPQFALSPDGRAIVFVANAQGQSPRLWVQPLSPARARALAGTEQASYPFWSADSRHVGFFSSGKLKRISIDGDPPAVVCDAPAGRGGTWNDAGVIVFASGINDPLRRVAASGGTPAPMTVVDVPRENSHRWPRFLPDGRHVLFWAGAGTGPAQLKVASLDSSDTSSVVPVDANASYSAGHLFFKRGAALMAQPFDAGTLQTRGDPIQVVAPISADAGSAFASFSTSASGTIVYTRGTARPLVLTWFNRRGRAIGTFGEPGQYTNATLSPDGKRLALSLTAGTPANRDVWTLDVPGGKASRLTSSPAVEATPVWSPDGARIAFSSQRDGPYQMYVTESTPAGDTPNAVPLLKSETATIATDWSPYGQHIAFTRTGSTTGLDVWVLPLAKDGVAFPFAETRAVEDNAAFSPDGRWIAFQSSESGRDEVYVRAFPPAGDQYVVSRNGGTQPRWRGDGRELFFLAPDGSVMAAPIAFTPGFSAGTPQTIVPAAMTLVIRHAYTVTKDGQRVLMPVLDRRNPPRLSVIQWPSPASK